MQEPPLAFHLGVDSTGLAVLASGEDGLARRFLALRGQEEA